jgi:hypothetical protein
LAFQIKPEITPLLILHQHCYGTATQIRALYESARYPLSRKKPSL